MIGANNTNIYDQNITATTWEKISNGGGCYASFGGTGFEAIGSGNCNNWSVQAKITATNSCGTTTIYRTITPPPPYPCDDDFSFAKNPMKSGESIASVIIIDPCDSSNTAMAKQQNYTISIFTNFGENVYNKTQTDTEFDLSTLKKGFYIVKFTTSKGNIITKKLIVD